ncbi:MAG TPA: hypothetical protein PKE30_06265 [Niabella sp.]|nr:hypothetical protein [Niabella sp.]
MNIKTIRILKFALPAVAILLSIILVSFKSNVSGNKKLLDPVSLTFRYQEEDFGMDDVADRSNWQKVNPEDACTQVSNDAACSFSIEVESAQQSLYLNGNEPSSKVIINPAKNSSTNNHYVSSIQQDVSGTPSPITNTVSNIIP